MVSPCVYPGWLISRGNPMTGGSVWPVTFYIGGPISGGKDRETATRTPRYHTGWLSVRYKGRRYQLHGGIRHEYWINPNRPIEGAPNDG